MPEKYQQMFGSKLGIKPCTRQNKMGSKFRLQNETFALPTVQTGYHTERKWLLSCYFV